MLLLPLQNVPRIISFFILFYFFIIVFILNWIYFDSIYITLLRELESLRHPVGNHTLPHVSSNSQNNYNSSHTALVKLLALMDRLNQNFQFVDPLDLLNCTPNDMGYPEVMGGSLPQLVERLTHHNIYGMLLLFILIIFVINFIIRPSFPRCIFNDLPLICYSC